MEHSKEQGEAGGPEMGPQTVSEMDERRGDVTSATATGEADVEQAESPASVGDVRIDQGGSAAERAEHPTTNANTTPAPEFNDFAGLNFHGVRERSFGADLALNFLIALAGAVCGGLILEYRHLIDWRYAQLLLTLATH